MPPTESDSRTESRIDTAQPASESLSRDAAGNRDNSDYFQAVASKGNTADAYLPSANSLLPSELVQNDGRSQVLDSSKSSKNLSSSPEISYPSPQAQATKTCEHVGQPQIGQVSHYGGPGDPGAPDGELMKNGVPFDHRKATIASNTLPMNTRVDIETPDGKFVGATVTDTGAFSKPKYGGGRVADLSQGTFRSIADPKLGKLNGVKIHKCKSEE